MSCGLGDEIVMEKQRRESNRTSPDIIMWRTPVECRNSSDKINNAINI